MTINIGYVSPGKSPSHCVRLLVYLIRYCMVIEYSSAGSPDIKNRFFFIPRGVNHLFDRREADLFFYLKTFSVVRLVTAFVVPHTLQVLVEQYFGFHKKFS